MNSEAKTHRWRDQLNARLGLDKMPVVRKVVYSVVGFTVILIGIVMIVLPGPAIVIIPLGLAILATEFAWARKILRRGKIFVDKLRDSKVLRKIT
jgi:uncharacterized protein (TIGR02611 family)